MKLSLQSLTKKFFTIRGWIGALENIHLEIEDGEFFVLVGPSGCGKSTLLNLIAGLEKPTGGDIFFGDAPVSSSDRNIFVPTKERNVAMVFQSYALYPHMTVFENIAFPLRIARVQEENIRNAVGTTAALLEISDLLRAKPKELSGGERQRVAIARAIVRKPDIFLMDEPLSNLDAKLRLTTRTELKNLQRKIGTTTVYVTHDQVEAMSLGDRIGVINDGFLQQVGTPLELYEKPVNPFVATFIGTPPMNLIEVRLLRELDHHYVDLDGRKLPLPPSRVESSSLQVGDKCLLGIRPEHITLASHDCEGEHTFSAAVTSVETLGREILIHLEMGGKKLSVLSGSFDPGGRNVVSIVLDPDSIHLFPHD